MSRGGVWIGIGIGMGGGVEIFSLRVFVYKMTI